MTRRICSLAGALAVLAGSLEIRADGSGTFTFDDMEHQVSSSDPPPHPAIAGSISWTCSDG
jgi:hypothetical protein